MEEKMDKKAFLEWLNTPRIKTFINENNWDEVFSSWFIKTNEDDMSILTEILIEADIEFLPYISKIYNSCFAYLTIKNEKYKNLELPNNIKEIEDWAFFGCKGIDTLTIPSSVKKLGSEAFSSSSIKEVICKGKQEDWLTLITLIKGNSNIKFTVVEE